MEDKPLYKQKFPLMAELLQAIMSIQRSCSHKTFKKNTNLIVMTYLNSYFLVLAGGGPEFSLSVAVSSALRFLLFD